MVFYALLPPWVDVDANFVDAVTAKGRWFLKAKKRRFLSFMLARIPEACVRACGASIAPVRPWSHLSHQDPLIGGAERARKEGRKGAFKMPSYVDLCLDLWLFFPSFTRECSLSLSLSLSQCGCVSVRHYAFNGFVLPLFFMFRTDRPCMWGERTIVLHSLYLGSSGFVLSLWLHRLISPVSSEGEKKAQQLAIFVCTQRETNKKGKVI